MIFSTLYLKPTSTNTLCMLQSQEMEITYKTTSTDLLNLMPIPCFPATSSTTLMDLRKPDFLDAEILGDPMVNTTGPGTTKPPSGEIKSTTMLNRFPIPMTQMMASSS